MKTKLQLLKFCGVALLWVGLASLVFVPTTSDGITATIVAGLGFLSFASGAIMLLDYLISAIHDKLTSGQDKVD